MKEDLKSKTVLVCDNGVFVDFANRLGETFGKVYYYNPWQDSFPKMNKAFVGYGLENIEVTHTIWDKIKSIDLFVFPDLYFPDLQNYLSDEGYRVWGMKDAERLENDRDYCKKEMKKLGLPVGNYTIVKGMDALREYLKKHDNVYVKISQWRGTFETFKSENYKKIEPKLDEVEYNLGAFKYIIDFIIEDELPDKVEIGSDLYVVNGEYPDKCITGIEIKDLGYLCKFTDYKKVPEVVTGFNETMKPLLRKSGARGFFSTEIRVGKDMKPFMIDFCARLGSPPNEIYQEMYDNIAEIIWYGSEGKMIQPVSKYKYGVEILIHSPWADKNWQPIDFPKEIRKYVKLRNACRINGNFYVIPQAVGLPEIGAVLGFGNTIDEAINHAKDNASKINGYYINIPEECMDKAMEVLKETESIGIKLF